MSEQNQDQQPEEEREYNPSNAWEDAENRVKSGGFAKKSAPMEKPAKADVDLAKAAEEFKAQLDDKKMSLIDYGYVNIECWFSKDELESGKFPEVAKLTKQWEALFDYADTVTEDDGTGFPNDDVVDYENDLQVIEDMVNADAEFWAKLRAEVIPLYEKSPHFKAWKKRWKFVKLFYDPVGMDVTTTQMYTNKITGERTRGEEISKRTIPAGFVISIDKKSQKETSVFK